MYWAFHLSFRGALDVRATKINEEMKLAAVYALAELAKEAVPENVNLAYNSKNITFGKDYIIPKPVDNRLIYKVAPAVAKAAIESGVARYPITDWEAYENELIQRLGLDNKLMKNITIRAKQKPQRVVFAEADHYKILKAAQQVKDEGIAIPILLGDTEKIKTLINDNNLDLKDIAIIDIRQRNFDEKRNYFGDLFFEKRKRRGFTLFEARKAMLERNYYGAMMVETGEADAMISGLTRKYPDTIRPSLQIIGVQKEIGMVAGMYIMVTKKGPVFFADTTINTNPTVDQLVKIVLLTANAVKLMNIVPRIALLSYSNFGSVDNAETRVLREAIAILHQEHPDLIVDGEVQANIALNKEIMEEQFPFSPLKTGNVNTLIFPNLASGNIAYKLMQEMGTAEAIGPVLLGLKKSVHILQLGSSVREIVNMVTLAVADAQVKNNVFDQ
jgi:malate dehydrogenase (oxaloacetate-decarboxylating)(NADP+)